jgi:hypothetical protein
MDVADVKRIFPTFLMIVLEAISVANMEIKYVIALAREAAETSRAESERNIFLVRLAMVLSATLRIL